MNSFRQYEPEQASEQGTKGCLGLKQEVIRNLHLPPPSASADENKKDKIIWLRLSYTKSQAASECSEQPTAYATYGLKNGFPFEIHEQLSIVRQHQTETLAKACLGPLQFQLIGLHTTYRLVRWRKMREATLNHIIHIILYNTAMHSPVWSTNWDRQRKGLSQRQTWEFQAQHKPSCNPWIYYMTKIMTNWSCMHQ